MLVSNKSIINAVQAIDGVDVMERSQCIEGIQFNCTTDDVCPNYVGSTIDRAWQNSYYNFDNVGNGMLTLFVVATIDNPMDIIGYQTMDAVGTYRGTFRTGSAELV